MYTKRNKSIAIALFVATTILIVLSPLVRAKDKEQISEEDANAALADRLRSNGKYLGTDDTLLLCGPVEIDTLVSEGLLAAGVNQDELVEMLKTRLRQAGVPLTPKGGGLSMPVLRLQIDGAGPGGGTVWAVGVKIDLYEHTALLRKSKRKQLSCHAVTWSRGKTWLLDRELLVATIEESARELADQFAIDYLRANQGQPQPTK
jgi:hypothetical protein